MQYPNTQTITSFLSEYFKNHPAKLVVAHSTHSDELLLCATLGDATADIAVSDKLRYASDKADYWLLVIEQANYLMWMVTRTKHVMAGTAGKIRRLRRR